MSQNTQEENIDINELHSIINSTLGEAFNNLFSSDLFNSFNDFELVVQVSFEKENMVLHTSFGRDFKFPIIEFRKIAPKISSGNPIKLQDNLIYYELSIRQPQTDYSNKVFIESTYMVRILGQLLQV